MLKGIDISEFQGNLDFNKLKDAVDFVIIRSTFGDGRKDKLFEENRDKARNNGILHGFYHYSYPNYNGPEDEANWFADSLSDLQKGELLFLDYEENWNGDKVDWCKKFLDQLSQRFNGYKPLLYITLNTLQTSDWKRVKDGNYGLWLAHWTYDVNSNEDSNLWPVIAFRQYSNKENIAGITPVDGDIFYGDKNAFLKYGFQSGNIPPSEKKQGTPPNTYTVKSGDTLSGIAQKFGISLAILEQINKVNIPDPNKIFPGEIVFLGNGTAPSQKKTHTVIAGESLSSIAQKELGNSNRWKEIYDLNKGIIGNNPNTIFPGQILTLP